jgi:hypothetical protein
VRHADVAEIACTVARRYVHTAAQRDGEVSEVATDAASFNLTRSCDLAHAIGHGVDFDGERHGQMIRCRTIPITLQRDSFARVMHHRDTDETLISDDAARRIEIDPAGAGNVGLNPRMGVASSQAVLVIILGKMDVSRHETRGNAA